MAAWECRWSGATSIPRGKSKQKGASAFWSTPSSAAQCASGSRGFRCCLGQFLEGGLLQSEPTGVSGRRAPCRMTRREYATGLQVNLGQGVSHGRSAEGGIGQWSTPPSAARVESHTFHGVRTGQVGRIGQWSTRRTRRHDPKAVGNRGSRRSLSGGG